MSNDLSLKTKDPEKLAVLKIETGEYKGKQFRLLGGKVSIGRSSNCDIVLKNNKSCSDEHAVIAYGNKSGIYTIQSLDIKNPVIVNKKPVDLHKLQSKDKIVIGGLVFVFSNESPLPTRQSKEHKKFQKHGRLQKQKQNKTMVRIGFVVIICFGLAYFLLGEETKKQQAQKGLKTEKEVLEEIEILKTLSDDVISQSQLSSKEKSAQVAFLKGFRDYRKGYYYRALKAFEHCTTVHKDNTLCKSYTVKTKVQLERLIQKKIILGKTYKANKQYHACQAAFKGVELLVRDIESPIFKEALENRRLCQLKSKNKI